jgi:hypothetical protein
MGCTPTYTSRDHIKAFRSAEKAPAENKKIREAQIAFFYETEDIDAQTQLPGAQRCRFMLLKLLKVITLYHPLFSRNDRFKVKLAHRRVPYPMGYNRDFADQAYLKLKSIEGKTGYAAITTADITSIMDPQKATLPFSDQRKASYTRKVYANWDSFFMVMAD